MQSCKNCVLRLFVSSAYKTLFWVKLKAMVLWTSGQIVSLVSLVALHCGKTWERVSWGGPEWWAKVTTYHSVLIIEDAGKLMMFSCSFFNRKMLFKSVF